MAENKVIKLQKQILELTKEINKNGEATKKQAKELEKLEKQYNKLSAKQMPQYRKRHEEVNKQLGKANKLTSEATKKTQSFGSRIGGAIKTLGAYGIAYRLINAATQLFTELTVGSAKQAIEFQKTIANLGAVAGVSGKELESLSRNALDVAGKTKFTAQEIVGLQTELSKLGFSAGQVVNATQSIAFAAQALNAPLNSVAEQTGKVINQFDLLSEQASFVGDVLVTAINESALSFDSFGTAIQYVGPIAKELGLTFEQTAGAMAVLADNGFTASRIGTGLRGIFTELGKTTADVEQSLKSLAEQNISLSEAVDLVGKRNAAQLITLLDNIDAIDEANGKYYQQGRAFAAAAQQADTWAGQMEILTSNFREFQIGIGDVIAESDALIVVLDNLFPKGADTARAFRTVKEKGFDVFNEGVKNVAEGADVLTEALKLTGISFSDYNEAVIQMEKSGINPFGNEKEIVSEVNGIIKAINEMSKEMINQRMIVEGQTIATDKYQQTIDGLTDAYIKQIDVTEDVDRTAEDVKNQLEDVNKIVETGIILQEDWVTGRTEGVELTEEEILKYKGLQGQLNSYLDTLTNIIFKEDKLQTNREKRSFKDELSDYIERIKETEKVISELPEGVSDKIFFEQMDLLNGFFGSAEDVVSRASERFGPDSDFVKSLISTLKKASSKVSVELPKDPFADTILDPSYLESFNENNIDPNGVKVTRFTDIELDYSDLASFDEDDVEGVTKIAKTFSQKLKDAFKEVSIADVIAEGLDKAADSIESFNDTALQNTTNRLEAEKSAISNRYRTENDVLRSQLDNQLITESQFRVKQRQLQKAKVAEENDIDRQLFDAQKKRDRQNANTDYLQALASIIPNLIINDGEGNPVTLSIKSAISAGLTTAAYGAELSAIGQRKFFPKKFEQGGMVSGPSHADGGVPFTVQGQGGYEMEGGEYIINKRATSMHKDLLDRINKSGMSRPQAGRLKFAEGGIVGTPLNESVDYLKAIAEATTSTAIGVSRPVRAYVSDKDLRSNANERRIRDRNDRI